MTTTYENFEDYWEAEWIPTNQPAVFDLAMKEIAQKAWNAGSKCGYNKGYRDGAEDERLNTM